MLPGVLSFSVALTVPPAEESARTEITTANALRPVIADPFRAVRRERPVARCEAEGLQDSRASKKAAMFSPGDKSVPALRLGTIGRAHRYDRRRRSKSAHEIGKRAVGKPPAGNSATQRF